MESIMWCPHRGSWNRVVYALLGRMAWEQLYFSSLSCILKYFLLGVARTPQAGGGKSILYLSPPPPIPTPTVFHGRTSCSHCQRKQVIFPPRGHSPRTSNVYSKQWSWNSFANKRSQEFFIVENITLPTGRGCFQLTNTTHAFKHTSLWAELVFAETLHGPSDVTWIYSPSSYFVITLIVRS